MRIEELIPQLRKGKDLRLPGGPLISPISKSISCTLEHFLSNNWVVTERPERITWLRNMIQEYGPNTPALQKFFKDISGEDFEIKLSFQDVVSYLGASPNNWAKRPHWNGRINLVGKRFFNEYAFSYELTSEDIIATDWELF